MEGASIVHTQEVTGSSPVAPTILRQGGWLTIDGSTGSLAVDIQMERQQAHALIDQLPLAKLGAVRSLLEVMVDDNDDELTDEDRSAIAASREYIQQGGECLSYEQVVAECGFSMEQIRASSKEV